MKKSILFLLLISNYSFSQDNPGHKITIQNHVVKKPQHDPPLVINDYTEVLAFDICKNEIIVKDASKFKIGDTVVMMQMKGAVIDTSNTAAFGSITDYKNAGNYEFNYIAQKTGNTVIFQNQLTRNYDVPDGVVQLIRVPYFSFTYGSAPLTCEYWDGFKGGVLIINADTLYLQEFVDVNGRGFFGGEGFNSNNNTLSCFENNYFYPAGSIVAGLKGESITTISQNRIRGKGNLAAGGGGGLGHNSGGGGGSNGGAGGFGGYQSDLCGGPPFDNRGIGGRILVNNATINKVFMGSGGGAGNADDMGNYPMSGGRGGGIIIMNAKVFMPNGLPVSANGDSGRVCNFFESINCLEGMSGAGAGGTIVLNCIKIVSSSPFEIKGGNGADMKGAVVVGGRLGPGGGGGGGVFFMNRNSLPPGFTVDNSGGKNGVIINDSNNPWGSTAGNDGQNIFDLVLPVDSVLFKKNIDSVRFSETILSCNNFNFMGFGYTNTSAITSWQWFFGDGGTSSIQNPAHTYINSGTYPVKLIAADINGCKDSTNKTVTVSVVTAEAGNNQSFCSNGTISATLNGTGSGNNYSWTPALLLNDPNLQNPVATINATTIFYLTVSNNAGCSGTDSVTIIINPVPVINAVKSNDIDCSIASSFLMATGALQYSWAPSSTLNNSFIANPVAKPIATTTYTVMGMGNGGCQSSDTITVIVNFRPGLFEVPNSFTPNGDGLNDCFRLKFWGNVQNLEFIIYNYLGQKVFETNNISGCWDGTYKGKKADPGNYVYVIKAKTFCGPVERQGNILLIR